MTTSMHPLAEDYLRRLYDRAHSLPPQDRDELLAELRSHLESGLPENPSDADVRNVLHELGAPEDIVAAAQASESEGGPSRLQQTAYGPPARPASPWGTLEVIAVVALTAGAFVLPVVGPIVGIVLVWGSAQWTRREKTVATVLSVLPVIILALGVLSLVTIRTSSQNDTVVPQPAATSSPGEHS